MALNDCVADGEYGHCDKAQADEADLTARAMSRPTLLVSGNEAPFV